VAVRVDVDGFDAFPSDHHGQGLACRLLGICTVKQATTAKDNAGGGSRTRSQEITACRHEKSSLIFFCGTTLGYADSGQQGGTAPAAHNPFTPA